MNRFYGRVNELSYGCLWSNWYLVPKLPKVANIATIWVIVRLHSYIYSYCFQLARLFHSSNVYCVENTTQRKNIEKNVQENIEKVRKGDFESVTDPEKLTHFKYVKLWQKVFHIVPQLYTAMQRTLHQCVAHASRCSVHTLERHVRTIRLQGVYAVFILLFIF